MKRETIQDEFRQMITRRLKARKRAKAAAIQPMVYARHAKGRASPIRKTPSRREGGSLFPSGRFVRLGREEAKRPSA